MTSPDPVVYVPCVQPESIVHLLIYGTRFANGSSGLA